MTGVGTPAPYRPLVRAGFVLLGLAALLGLVTAFLVLAPARAMKQQTDIGSTLVLDVPADRDWAVYSTLSTWRAAVCEVTADGRPIVLRPDMLQQTLHGWPTWYPQGSFEPIGPSGSQFAARDRRGSSRSGDRSASDTCC